MSELQTMRQERSVLKWGGLAGIGGSILLVAAFVIVGVLVGAPSGPVETVMNFPEVRAAHMVEEALYLGALALWAIHFVAMYRALRRTRLASALFGSALGVTGLVVLAAGALPQVAKAPLSALYHAPGATSQEQATVVLLWQATQGMLNALLVTGLLLVPIGLIGLGVAALKAPAFGKGYGGLSVALGGVALAAAFALVSDVSEIAVVAMLSLIVFHIVLGWKVYSLSKTFSESAAGKEVEAIGRPDKASGSTDGLKPSPIPR